MFVLVRVREARQVRIEKKILVSYFVCAGSRVPAFAVRLASFRRSAVVLPAGQLQSVAPREGVVHVGALPVACL